MLKCNFWLKLKIQKNAKKNAKKMQVAFSPPNLFDLEHRNFAVGLQISICWIHLCIYEYTLQMEGLHSKWLPVCLHALLGEAPTDLLREGGTFLNGCMLPILSLARGYIVRFNTIIECLWFF